MSNNLTGCAGLKLLSLDVPSAVMQGESAWLNCTLDLESDELYSVKWYKDDVEFYRHLPKDSPNGQKYDIPGIRLDPLAIFQTKFKSMTIHLQERKGRLHPTSE
ncbi:hypothetical protein JTE90_023917 [Oedothorax gibbosus]|uniref:Ig-like domain-containing protein n=1 Tax=Oedothorax gibbosus TaxID=931172 RepID=A0AAV6UMD4_9ARAC|nr:hypothetical protein JTE90_023917 [Oedothorax gibbosus]